MREIVYYRTRTGRSPVEEFLRGLAAKQAQKVDWVLRIIRGMDDVPAQYLKKLPGTDGLWEVRVQHGGDAFRLLAFPDGAAIVVLVSAFAKKTEQTPMLEIELAQQRRRDYLSRRRGNG
jgi:phage-related protein